MSGDTPRTEEHLAGLRRDPEISGCGRTLDFARQLERELAEARALIADLKSSECEQMGAINHQFGVEETLRMQLDAEREKVRRLREALIVAQPYIAWSDSEGREPEDYPESDAIIRADRDQVDAALWETKGGAE